MYHDCAVLQMCEQLDPFQKYNAAKILIVLSETLGMFTVSKTVYQGDSDVDVCLYVCGSISCNELVAEQNGSSDLIFVQLARLPGSRTYEGKSRYHRYAG